MEELQKLIFARCKDNCSLWRIMLLLVLLFLFAFSKPAIAAQIFTTTISNTTVERVQDEAINYMTDRNFALDRVETYTVTFTKGFGDGFWIASRNMIIKFNTLQRGENVRLMVTQFEDSPQAWIKGQRAIDHLIPLIKDIRHNIDGTPLDRIANEAKDESSNGKGEEESKSIPKSGLKFTGTKIESVDANQSAHKAGLLVGDVILEINAKAVSTEGDALTEILDRGLADGRSLMIMYERDGKPDILTLKPSVD